MQIKEITKQQFDSSNVLKFNFSKSSQRFGVLSDDERLAISWSSDDIFPIILSDKDDTFIGVDNAYLIYNSRSKLVKGFNFLNTFFLNFLSYKETLLILTEMELIVLNKYDYSMRQNVHFMDVIVDYRLDQGKFYVDCMDGSNSIIDLN